MTEREIIDILGRDHAVGTEAFRDALLARCLEVLGSGDDGLDLPDEELGLLAAAGDGSGAMPSFGEDGR